eukprot:TRINITY_DN8604_c0_g1_i1.p1 TRINITY_DN8604_c0_g1~~TRINITY_DN8604_c0_g1_i1.p1  ORF type:complete len:431 (+),score=84.25 TRINITY_DN8604_c0_g1_i1:1-1293(+)
MHTSTKVWTLSIVITTFLLCNLFIITQLHYKNTTNTHSKARLQPDPLASPLPVQGHMNHSLKAPDFEERSVATFDRVHVFYYPWYSNEIVDGAWNHWNHRILPHWNTNTRKNYKYNINYNPPEDIGSCYYPERGTYSSSNPDIINQHMSDLKDYLVVISWWGPKHKSESKDGEGFTTDVLVGMILQSAEKYGTKIAFHIEPYEGRSAESVRSDLEYLFEQYGSSEAFYRDPGSNLPVIYMYDSYHTPVEEWKELLIGEKSIRGTNIDSIILGLYLKHLDRKVILEAGFDGFYTYFGSDGFTEGSTSSRWENIVSWAAQNNLYSSISIGPGYNDERIRPWNAANTKSRENGEYFKRMWEKVINANPTAVSITSYNEWMEGTQIEEVVPKSIDITIYDGLEYSYLDYSPHDPGYYMELTAQYSAKWYNTNKL